MYITLCLTIHLGGGPGFLSRCLIPTPLGLALSSAQCHQRTPEGAHRASQAEALRGHLKTVAGKAGWMELRFLQAHPTPRRMRRRGNWLQGKAFNYRTGLRWRTERGGQGGRCRPCHPSSNLQRGDRRRPRAASQPAALQQEPTEEPSEAGRALSRRGSGSQSCSSLGAQWAPACGLHGVQMREN